MEKELGLSYAVYNPPNNTTVVKKQVGTLLLGDGHSKICFRRSPYEIVAELDPEMRLKKLTFKDQTHKILVKTDHSCNPTELSIFYPEYKNLVGSLMEMAREWLRANNVIIEESHQGPVSSKFSEVNEAGMLMSSARDRAPSGSDLELLSSRFSKIASLKSLGPKRGTSILKLPHEVVGGLNLREGTCYELDFDSDSKSVTFNFHEQNCWTESVFSDGIKLAIGVPHRQMDPSLHIGTKVRWVPADKENMLELVIRPEEGIEKVLVLRHMASLQCDYGVSFSNKIKDMYGIAEYMQCFWRKIENVPKLELVRNEKNFTTVRQMPSLNSKGETYVVLPHRVAEKYPNRSAFNFITDEKGRLVAALQK